MVSPLAPPGLCWLLPQPQVLHTSTPTQPTRHMSYRPSQPFCHPGLQSVAWTDSQGPITESEIKASPIATTQPDFVVYNLSTSMLETTLKGEQFSPRRDGSACNTPGLRAGQPAGVLFVMRSRLPQKHSLCVGRASEETQRAAPGGVTCGLS